MTFTFNPKKYQELLFTYQPKIIRTEAENEKVLAIVEELMHRSDRSPEEDELYELLITLVEKFEQDYYQSNSTVNLKSMLLFLLEQRGLTTQDLIKLLGSEAIVEDLINGMQSAYQQQSTLLGKFFNIDPSIFC